MQFLAIASAAMGVIQSINNANAQSAQYEAYMQAANYNAAVARQQAENAQKTADWEATQTRSAYAAREDQARRENRLEAGRRRAAIAQSGAGFSGTNYDLSHQSDVLAELDALNIRYEGNLIATGQLKQGEYSAFAYGNEANLQNYYAQQYQSASSSAKRAGWIGAAGSILSGAGDYMKASRYGAPAATTGGGVYYGIRRYGISSPGLRVY